MVEWDVHTQGAFVNANRIPWTEFKTMMNNGILPGTEIKDGNKNFRIYSEQELYIEAYSKIVPRTGFDLNQRNITSSKPVTMHDAINMAHELVEQAVQGKLPGHSAAAPADGFDVIIAMDWLSYHQAVIDGYENIVHTPLSNGEILEVQGERPEKDPGSLVCIKADEKKLDDIRVVRDSLRKERLKPRRVCAMSITIHSGLKTKILETQGEASKDLKAKPAKLEC
ncbi:hypothetical protein Tco_0488866 [Tanacetum coccineum]